MMTAAPSSPAPSAGKPGWTRRHTHIALMVGLNAILLSAVVSTALIAVGGARADGRAAAVPSESAETTSETAETIPFPADTPAAAAGEAPCTQVRVLSSFENAEMVDTLVAAYAASPRSVDGTCVSVTAAKSKSGTAATNVAAGFPALATGTKPTLWIPDASIWAEQAAAAGADAAITGSAGSSNIVLAMPEPLAEASGWIEAPPSWQEIFAAADDETFWSSIGHDEWGRFKLGKTSPLVASSGAAAIYASFSDAAGHLGELTAADAHDVSVRDEVRAHELATSHYMATPEHFLWHAREAEKNGSSADFLSAVIVDEKSVWDYNRGITSRDGITRIASDAPAVPLVPVYPSDGFYAADDPIVPLDANATAAEQAATADFIRFIGTEDGQVAVRASGYRDLNGELDPSVAAVGGLRETAAAELTWPSADAVTAVNAAFPDVRKRANVMFLIDVSGSMDDPVAGSQSKLTAAKSAITLALDHFAAGDQVGLAAFAQDPTGTLVPGVVTPQTDAEAGRTALVSGVQSLTSMGDTPLFEAVATYADVITQSWDPDRINALVVLSDGENDTNTPTTTSEEMLTALHHGHHSGTPVMVFTLAYGAAADTASLQTISSATGAHFYDATDPSKLAEVLADLVTSF